MTEIEKPAHYAGLKVDVIDFCQVNNIPFCEGNVIKYVCRWRQKNGVEDLKKAMDYLQRLIDSVEHNHGATN